VCIVQSVILAYLENGTMSPSNFASNSEKMLQKLPNVSISLHRAGNGKKTNL
jgi:hypothetical protein